MIVYKKLNIKSNFKKAVIAIGNFDGLHLGHQKVLKEAKQKYEFINVLGPLCSKKHLGT